MAKKHKQAWPTQYLVLWRTTLDDVPILLTPDRKEAFGLAGAIGEDHPAVRRGHKGMGLDQCSAVNVTVVTFRLGVPYRMKIVQELT